ncbi:MAG: AAA family ATPase, partial [Deltaproteobacteria bacterium]|nr:AAA family ATPase [Deltaproteobacteria bacterium]
MAVLLDIESEGLRGRRRITGLSLSVSCDVAQTITHVAFLDDLVQLRRQQEGLRAVMAASDVGPLGPLRALLGLAPPEVLDRPARPVVGQSMGDFDGDQRAALRAGIATPHFARIEGPPGSGKTKVITELISHALSEGGRVLVVSSTNVAVDNVVERMTDVSRVHRDDLQPGSLPSRYAAKESKVSRAARPYAVTGGGGIARTRIVQQRLAEILREAVPLATQLTNVLDPGIENGVVGPLTSQLCADERLICGTTIGILSHEKVGTADVGAFDVLIVDEVSKLTIPEFLAIAVKAKRWILVGDPMQLPPHLDAELTGAVLEAARVLDPAVELASSVALSFEKLRSQERGNANFLVVASHPQRVAEAIRIQLRSCIEPVATVDVRLGVDGIAQPGIHVTGLEDFPCLNASAASEIFFEMGSGPAPHAGTVGLRLAPPEKRVSAAWFKQAGDLYHSLPWAEVTGCKLRQRHLSALPSVATIRAATSTDEIEASVLREELLRELAACFATNCISLYDHLAGLPRTRFPEPLDQLASHEMPGLAAAVQPYSVTLRWQYRMAPGISAVPRVLFYRGRALQDARPGGSLASLYLEKVPWTVGSLEDNDDEARAVRNLVLKTSRSPGDKTILVLTPYRAQEELLREQLKDLLVSEAIDVCTFDRCQGRESD